MEGEGGRKAMIETPGAEEEEERGGKGGAGGRSGSSKMVEKREEK